MAPSSFTFKRGLIIFPNTTTEIRNITNVEDGKKKIKSPIVFIQRDLLYFHCRKPNLNTFYFLKQLQYMLLCYSLV